MAALSKVRSGLHWPLHAFQWDRPRARCGCRGRRSSTRRVPCPAPGSCCWMPKSCQGRKVYGVSAPISPAVAPVTGRPLHRAGLVQGVGLVGGDGAALRGEQVVDVRTDRCAAQLEEPLLAGLQQTGELGALLTGGDDQRDGGRAVHGLDPEAGGLAVRDEVTRRPCRLSSALCARSVAPSATTATLPLTSSPAKSASVRPPRPLPGPCGPAELQREVVVRLAVVERRRRISGLVTLAVDSLA